MKAAGEAKQAVRATLKGAVWQGDGAPEECRAWRRGVAANLGDSVAPRQPN